MPTSPQLAPENVFWERAGKPKVLQQVRACLIALLATAAGTDLRYAIDSVLNNRIPFILSSLAVGAASYFGGLTAGIVTLILSAAADTYLFAVPRFNLVASVSANRIALAVFMGVGLLLALIGSWIGKKRTSPDRH